MRTTSKTIGETEQVSRNKELRVREWQPQDCWKQCPDSCMAVKPTTRVSQHTGAHVRNTTIVVIATGSVPTSAGGTTNQSKTDTVGYD